MNFLISSTSNETVHIPIDINNRLSQFRYSRLCEYFDSENERELHAEISKGPKIRFNVSGLKLTISEKLLLRYPNTLLASPSKLHRFQTPDDNDDDDLENGNYIFERDVECFKAILNIYRTGSIRKPENVQMSDFLRELIFFEFDEDVITRFQAQEGVHLAPTYSADNWNYNARQYWHLFTEPYSSKYATIISVIRIVLILVSVSVRTEILTKNTNPRYYSIALASFIIINIALMLDLCIRMISCPALLKLLTRPSILLADVISSICFGISLILEMTLEGKTALDLIAIIVVQNLQTLSLFHLFDFFKTNTITSALSKTVFKNWFVLSQLLQVILVTAAIAGAVMFFIESFYEQPIMFDIGEGVWWAIVSMLTIGYGDIVPREGIAKIAAAAFIYISQIVTAMIIPIACSLYCRPYENERDIEQMLRRIVKSNQAEGASRGDVVVDVGDDDRNQHNQSQFFFNGDGGGGDGDGGDSSYDSDGNKGQALYLLAIA